MLNWKPLSEPSMKMLRLGSNLVFLLIKDYLFYPNRFITDTLILLSRCGVLLFLYAYVARLHAGSIGGIAYDSLAWSIFFYFAFSTLRLRDISHDIMRDVQSGSVEVFLNKPINYVFYRMWWRIGTGIVPFLVLTIAGSCVLVFLVGVPDSIRSLLFFGTLIPVVLFGILLSLFIYSIVGLMAFWMEDINPIYWIVDKAVMILGGSYLPIALFPRYLAHMALWSPFGASQFITHTVYEGWSQQWVTKIAIQVGWCLILGFFVWLIYSRAKKMLSVNGG